MTNKDADSGALGQIRALRQQRQAQEEVQAEPAARIGEIPAARQPAQSLVVETSTVAARVPHYKALAYEARVLAAKSFLPSVNKQIAMEALLALVQDEAIFQRWLDEIENLQKRE